MFDHYSDRVDQHGIARFPAMLAIAFVSIVLGIVCPASGQVPLDSLTDQELVDLYAAIYQESLRDSIVDKSNLVRRGRTVMQIGYTYTTDSNGDAQESRNAHTLPELLIRHSWSDRLELRFAWGGVTLTHSKHDAEKDHDWDSEILNPSIGIRVGVWPQDRIIPNVSLTASSPVDLRSSTGVFARLTPQVAAGYSWFVHERWLFSGSTGVVWSKGLDTRERERRFLDLQQTFAIDRLITSRLSGYLQWVANFPEGSRIRGIGHSLGPGISMPIRQASQVDFGSLFGLDQDSPDFGFQLFLSRVF